MISLYQSYLSVVLHPFLWIAVGFVLIFFLVQSLVARKEKATAPDKRLANIAEWLGMKNLHPVFFLLGALTWLIVAVTLLFGLYLMIWQLIWTGTPQSADARWEWRFGLAQIAALTTVLGAVIALPLTMARLRLNRRQTTATERQTETAEQGHITDRINIAVQGLGAEKTVSKIGRSVTIWTGNAQEITHIVPDYKDWRLEPRSRELKRYQSVSFLGPGEDAEEFEGLHIDVQTWPTARTVIEWQGEPEAKIQDGEHRAEEGPWEVFSSTEPNLEVRIGAIYALERIAQDSDRDHVQIMEILCAYIRENAPKKEAEVWPRLTMKPSEEDGPLEADWEARLEAFLTEYDTRIKGVTCRTDIQVTLEVIGRRSAKQRRLEAGRGTEAHFVFDTPCPDPNDYFSEDKFDPAALAAFKTDLKAWKETIDDYAGYRLDLRRTNLRRADLSGLNLNGARFDHCEMQGAFFAKTQLQSAIFWDAGLQRVFMSDARLQGANLRWTRLQGASLLNAQMYGAQLIGSELQGANTVHSKMQGAYLIEVQMQGADLSGAKMQGAELSLSRIQSTNFFVAQMQGALLSSLRIDEFTRLTGTSFRGAAARLVDGRATPQLGYQLEEMFGDGSVVLPEGTERPEHWPQFEMEEDRFEAEWRKWQSDQKGYVPPNPPKETSE